MAMFACLPRKHMQHCFLAVAGLLAVFAAPPAHAQVGSARYSSIVIDASNGAVLESDSANQPRHPASLTKLMTLYLTFEALRDRRITLNQLVPVSAHAASMEPTKLGLVPGSKLTVQQAILGLVTKSANDAAAALGEFLGGSEDRFAQMMTLRARALGMANTTFENASGLPDPDQWTTAHDLAILARRLITDFPGDYRYFSTPSFVWHRQVIFNHDSMLKSYPGADGMKTGYTDASGHNLITSAMRGGVRLIGVVLGASTNGERDIQMTALLNQGFQQMDVPIERKPVLVASRMPLTNSAHAAELPHPPEVTRVSEMRPPPHPRPATWAVHVGAFRSQAAARSAALVARREADAGEIRVQPVRLRGKVVWRASVVGLTHSDAADACGGHRKGSCQMIRTEARQVASR